MYLYEETVTEQHTRVSKLGNEHVYNRTRRVIVFRCDNCRELFRRNRDTMSPKRLSNNYFHCCENCDSKKFAQKKGAERRTIWDKPASSLDDISRL
jgi:hypothetical protein